MHASSRSPLAALLALVALIGAFFWRIAYPDYMNARTAVADVPGVQDSAYVPQGATYLAAGDCYISCGYMNDDTDSRLFLLRDGAATCIILQRADGSAYGGHAGGVTCAGNYVYISNQSQLFVLDAQALLAAQDGDTVAFLGSIPVPCNASFCSCDGALLYVGEYHADGYETDESHRVTTPDGSEYQALVFAYRVDPAAQFGLETAPCAAYAVCDEIQGFAVTPDGTAVLSQSAGFSNAKLLQYRGGGEPDGTVTIGVAALPLYALDSLRQTATMKLPRMSEDLECCDGQILVSFEACAKKFYPQLLPFAEDQMVLLALK
ncbi:MAG: hypothetical protein IJK64_03930 [Clostridia bacterium]|nr:hypothetical protein [Clostridia bacterium]